MYQNAGQNAFAFIKNDRKSDARCKGICYLEQNKYKRILPNIQKMQAAKQYAGKDDGFILIRYLFNGTT